MPMSTSLTVIILAVIICITTIVNHAIDRHGCSILKLEWSDAPKERAM